MRAPNFGSIRKPRDRMRSRAQRLNADDPERKNLPLRFEHRAKARPISISDNASFRIGFSIRELIPILTSLPWQLALPIGVAANFVSDAASCRAYC